MDGRCISQNELAQRWQISESTLERWRSQRTGPVFLRLGGQVRYRVTDIEAFETQAMGMTSGQISDKMANELRFRKPVNPKNARQVRAS
jgi:predicted DNA-binding transcriptional regulator AlpA